MSKYSVKFHKCNPAITQIDIQGILGDGRLSLQALDFMPDRAKVVVSYLYFVLCYIQGIPGCVIIGIVRVENCPT